MPDDSDKEKRVYDTLSDIEIKEAKKKLAPSTLGVPDSPHIAVPDPTPIKDMSQEMAYVAIGEMRKYTKSIAEVLNSELPAIKKTAQAAADNAEDARKEVQILGVRFDGIEKRVCDLESDTSEIEEKVNVDVREGVKTREQVRALREETVPAVKTSIENVGKEIKSVKARPGRLILAFVGVIVAVLSSAFLITWKASAVNTQIENDRTNNAKQFKTLNDTLQKLPTKSDVASPTDVKTAVRTVSDSDGGVEDYCKVLSDFTVRRMKRTIPQDEWPNCTRFRE